MRETVVRGESVRETVVREEHEGEWVEGAGQCVYVPAGREG